MYSKEVKRMGLKSLKNIFGTLAGLAIGLMVFFCAVGVSHAVVLTFEDVSTVNYPYIPNGYGGLNWDNMIFTSKISDPGLYDENQPWYGSIRYGIVSGTQIARNGMGNPAKIFANPGEAFDFNGAYFTSARRHNLNIDIIGFRGDLQVYSQTISVDTASPTYFEFSYKKN